MCNNVRQPLARPASQLPPTAPIYTRDALPMSATSSVFNDIEAEQQLALDLRGEGNIPF
jgi:hypothetical protein